MGVRGGASDRSLTRATAPAVSGAFTLAGWGYKYANRAGEFHYFAGMEDTVGGKYCLIGYDSTGPIQVATDLGYTNAASSPALNTWFYWYIQRSSNNISIGWKTSGGSWVTATVVANLTWTPNLLIYLNDSYGEYVDIAVERLRCWTVALTQAELDAEMASATPVKTASLWSNVPATTTTDLSDTTGNGRGLTANGTLSTVTGPSFSGGGVTGAGTATVGGLTASAAGSVSVNAAGAAIVGAITATGTGSAAVATRTANGAATLGALTAAGAGSVGVNGTGAATLRITTAGAASAGVSATGAAMLGAIQAAGKAYRLINATVGGVVTASGRYFAVGGAPLVLAGFHTWANVSDTASTYPPAAFDWTAYLSALVSAGANYTKLWMMESARDWGDASPMYFTPLPWARTGPGNAADGRPKFDLTVYDSTYFERLRERAILAGNAGVYVCVQLFQGWHIESKGLAYNPWTYHPFNSANNINGVNGDANADGKGLETRLTTSTAIYNLQKAYVDQVIAAVGDLDNVIYEISNEDHNDSWDWQVALMGYIRTAEAGRAKQHLVGLTMCWPTTNNSQLAASAADWVSYADTDTTPDANTSGPVSAYDTDHNPNLFTAGRGWVWRALTRGHGGLWLMDEWAGETYGHDTRADSAWNVQRANLGYARTYAARLDLANATAQGSLSSTGYCLTKTPGRYQLLAYQDTSGAFTVNLTGLAGTFNLEWLRPATGATQAGGTVAGGATRTLTPPWAGEDAVALLELAGYYAAGAATLGGITAAGAASVAINAAVQAAVGALTAVAAGSVSLRGNGAAGVGAMVAVGAASVAVNGAAQAAVGGIGVVAAASVAVSAAGGAQVGGVVAVGAAGVAVSAAGAATVGAVTASGYGSVGAVVVAGSGSAALGAIAATGTASVAINAAGAAAIVVTAVGSASVGVNAAGAATVAATATATAAAGLASVAVNAAGQVTVAAIVAAGYAGSGTVGNGAAVLGSLVAVGAGSVAVAGAGQATVGEHVAAGAVGVPVAGAVAVQVGVVVAAGVASAQVTGSGAATLGAIAASGSGALTALPNIQGYGAATVGGIIAVGTVVVAWVAVMGRVSGPGGRGAVSGPGVKATV